MGLKGIRFILWGLILLTLVSCRGEPPTAQPPQPTSDSNVIPDTVTGMEDWLTTDLADFTTLDQLLNNGNWQEADQETWELIKNITGKVTNKEGQVLTEADVQQMPRQELRIIDQLWVKYSQGKFGFSTQRRIWYESGGKMGEFDWDSHLQCTKTIGWRQGETLLDYDDLTFNLETAPEGHLPAACCAGRIHLYSQLLD